MIGETSLADTAAITSSRTANPSAVAPIVVSDLPRPRAASAASSRSPERSATAAISSKRRRASLTSPTKMVPSAAGTKDTRPLTPSRSPNRSIRRTPRAVQLRLDGSSSDLEHLQREPPGRACSTDRVTTRQVRLVRVGEDADRGTRLTAEEQRGRQQLEVRPGGRSSAAVERAAAKRSQASRQRCPADAARPSVECRSDAPTALLPAPARTRARPALASCANRSAAPAPAARPTARLAVNAEGAPPFGGAPSRSR